MKKLVVIAAGLGWNSIEKRFGGKIGDMAFSPTQSVFPAVTCTAQASFRTNTLPREHGMVCNGIYSRNLMKPSFWEQSASLVTGKRIWEEDRKNGNTVGLFFFQQSLGENVDYILSPAPIHCHNGSMIMQNYTQPSDVASLISKECGTFPLYRYWGPLASPKVGDVVIKNFESFKNHYNPDIAYLYLPTLDYDLQRFGCSSNKHVEKSFSFIKKQLLYLQGICEKEGASLSIIGDYEITDVTRAPAFPNITLRKHDLFKVRMIKGMAYPDFYRSRAFALVDHEIAHVYVRDKNDIQNVASLLCDTNDYEVVEMKTTECEWGHENAGEILLVAKEGSWCAYPWWTDKREAPEYATHIDIHNKPGFDPCELFLEFMSTKVTLDASRIKGTHGRKCLVASYNI